MNYGDIFKNVLIFTIGTGIAGFIVKSLFGLYLSRDLEGYKTQLQAQHNREIEHLKADIRATAFENETRFVRLHEKRVEVIAELYKLLARTMSAFESWMALIQAGNETYSEKATKATNAGNVFFEFFDENQIYLDEKLCGLILKMRDAFRHAWANFGAGSERPNARDWLETWERFRNDIPPLRIEIERRVRAMLGVQSTE